MPNPSFLGSTCLDLKPIQPAQLEIVAAGSYFNKIISFATDKAIKIQDRPYLG